MHPARTSCAKSGRADGRLMLNSFLFTAERSERVEDWRSALEDLDDKELFWIALRDASEEEESALRASLIFWSSWGGFGNRDAAAAGGQNTTIVERDRV
jgi:hypothetical protein